MPTPTLSAPGVYVIEQLTGPTPPPLTVSPSTCGFAGEHWRGPVGRAIRCNSWSDFVTYFGGFNSDQVPVLANPYLAYSVYEFFMNGGVTAWIDRIGASASPGASASVTLVDSSATPQNTLELEVGSLGVAGSPGSWGDDVFWAVTAMPTTGRFTLSIYNGSLTASALVETWYDMSMVPTDSRYAPAIINSPTSGSLWVVATDLNDAHAFPSNQPAVANGQLSGGTDGTDPSVSDRVAAVTQGTSPFDYVPGVLNFNMPAEVNATVMTAAITYSETRPFTFLVIDPPSGETPAAAVAYLGTLTPVVSNAAMYSPWLVATNPSSPNLRSTILLPPGGFVLGQMVASDNAVGVWEAPAGLTTALSGVVQAERIFSPGDLGTLNNANVNALRTLANGQVVIWGTRTMESGYASLYVPVRRTLNFIEAALASLLEYTVFDPNDQLVWAGVIATCNNFLGNLLTAGAFPGTTQAQAYYIICDSTNNTPQSIASGVLNVTVGLALLYPIEFIVLTIAQFQGTTTVTAAAA